jgi:hypothetical protein
MFKRTQFIALTPSGCFNLYKLYTLCEVKVIYHASWIFTRVNLFGMFVNVKKHRTFSKVTNLLSANKQKENRLPMSAKEIRNLMSGIQIRICNPISHGYSDGSGVQPGFIGDVNLLLQMYGVLIGKAKARHPEYMNDIVKMDSKICEYFENLSRIEGSGMSFKIFNVASGKISEFLSFLDTLETTPPEERVSKVSYDKLAKEKDDLKKTVEIMVQYKGLPELNDLLEAARNISIPLDEYWVLALCSANLIEAVVNRKLEKLGAKADGSFRARYQKLCKIIKDKENRDIQQLLPIALYEGIRNKLDHASDSNRVTQKEAKDISKMVIEFTNEIFQKIS